MIEVSGKDWIMVSVLNTSFNDRLVDLEKNQGAVIVSNKAKSILSHSFQ